MCGEVVVDEKEEKGGASCPREVRGDQLIAWLDASDYPAKFRALTDAAVVRGLSSADLDHVLALPS